LGGLRKKADVPYSILIKNAVQTYKESIANNRNETFIQIITDGERLTNLLFNILFGKLVNNSKEFGDRAESPIKESSLSPAASTGVKKDALTPEEREINNELLKSGIIINVVNLFCLSSAYLLPFLSPNSFIPPFISETISFISNIIEKPPPIFPTAPLDLVTRLLWLPSTRALFAHARINALPCVVNTFLDVSSGLYGRVQRSDYVEGFDNANKNEDSPLVFPQLSDGVSSLSGLLAIITLFIMNSINEKGIQQSFDPLKTVDDNEQVQALDRDDNVPALITTPIIPIPLPVISLPQPIVTLPQVNIQIPSPGPIITPNEIIPIPSSELSSSPCLSPLASRSVSPIKSPSSFQLGPAFGGGDLVYYFISPPPLNPSQAFAQFSLGAPTTPIPLPFPLLSFLCSLVQGLKFYILLMNALIMKELKERLINPDDKMDLEGCTSINSVQFLLPHLGASLRLLYQLFSSSNLDPSQHVSSASEITGIRSPTLLIGISLNDYICSSGTLYTFIQAFSSLFVMVLFLQKSSSGGMCIYIYTCGYVSMVIYIYIYIFISYYFVCEIIPRY
jgi:hypothetical protein